MTLKNDTFLRALARQPTAYTPVWLMRQAGRYLPEYRKTRAEAGSFLNLMRTPELVTEVTLQPLRRFELDAAIVFSDILTIPDAMGLGLHVDEGKGPWFERPLRLEKDFANITTPNCEEKLGFVRDAIVMLKRELTVPLIGFAGSPFTLATYMIEGQSSPSFKLTKTLLYENPKLLLSLLNTLSESVSQYLLMQVKAGADALMIFDTWGSVLSAGTYHDFSLGFIRKIVQTLKATHPHIPIILFTKGCGSWLKQIAQTGLDAISLDWTIDLPAAFATVGNQVALQGNLDPSTLFASKQVIQQETQALLESIDQPGHIFNLGHGITPDVPPDHVKVLVDTVHATKPTYINKQKDKVY